MGGLERGNERETQSEDKDGGREKEINMKREEEISMQIEKEISRERERRESI